VKKDVGLATVKWGEKRKCAQQGGEGVGKKFTGTGGSIKGGGRVRTNILKKAKKWEENGNQPRVFVLSKRKRGDQVHRRGELDTETEFRGAEEKGRGKI